MSFNVRWLKRLQSGFFAAGYKTLVLTVDVPGNGKRERDMRNGFAVPSRYSLKSVLDGAMHPRLARAAAQQWITGTCQFRRG